MTRIMSEKEEQAKGEEPTEQATDLTTEKTDQVDKHDVEGSDDPETVAEWRDRALRAHAEMQNMRKRLDTEVEDRTRARTEALLSEFVTLQDHLQLALASMPEGLEQNKDSAQFAQGVRAIHMAMAMLLNRFGVSEIKPEATDPFNPDEHEAIRTEEREDLEQTQMELVRVGYRIGRRILRPAQVCLIKPVDPATNGDK